MSLAISKVEVEVLCDNCGRTAFGYVHQNSGTFRGTMCGKDECAFTLSTSPSPLQIPATLVMLTPRGRS